jgi:GNAT superfamily N-acetyltransferase
MTVRPARPEEADAITALAVRAKAHWGYDDRFLDACRPELSWSPEQIERQDVLVWEEDGALLGTTARGGTAPDGGLWAVFVDPGQHGRGIGRALAEAVLARAAGAGFRSLTIAADPNAEGFTRALGATRAGELPSDLLPGRVLPLLRFDLSRGAAASS